MLRRSPFTVVLRSLRLRRAYNHQRYDENVQNLTPADVYLGRGKTMLFEPERIKRQAIQQRRLLHQRQAA